MYAATLVMVEYCGVKSLIIRASNQLREKFKATYTTGYDMRPYIYIIENLKIHLEYVYRE